MNKEILEKLGKCEYGYYYNDFNVKKLFKDNDKCNCNDFEYLDKLKVQYIKENIIRKATPEEIEWIDKQEKVTDPDVLKGLLPLLEWLDKYGAFD